MNIYEIIKESYDNGKQLWLCSEKPLETAQEVVSFIGKTNKYRKPISLQKSVVEGDISRYIFNLTIPFYLITQGVLTESGYTTPGIFYDISQVPKDTLKKLNKNVPDDILEDSIKIMKMMKEITNSIDHKLLEEIALRKHVFHELPDPEEWAEKTHKLNENNFGDFEYNLFQRFLKRLRRDRNNVKVFADMLSELEGKSAEFLLKYFGNEKISRNVFLAVSSRKIPEVEHENWNLFLYDNSHKS